jgi:hypothetical protein
MLKSKSFRIFVAGITRMLCATQILLLTVTRCGDSCSYEVSQKGCPSICVPKVLLDVSWPRPPGRFRLIYHHSMSLGVRAAGFQWSAHVSRYEASIPKRRATCWVVLNSGVGPKQSGLSTSRPRQPGPRAACTVPC